MLASAEQNLIQQFSGHPQCAGMRIAAISCLCKRLLIVPVKSAIILENWERERAEITKIFSSARYGDVYCSRRTVIDEFA